MQCLFIAFWKGKIKYFNTNNGYRNPPKFALNICKYCGFDEFDQDSEWSLDKIFKKSKSHNGILTLDVALFLLRFIHTIHDDCWTVEFLWVINIVTVMLLNIWTLLSNKWYRKYDESETGYFKGNYRLLVYAYILFTQTHSVQVWNLCVHFFSALLYNVDARIVLSNTRQCWDRQHKWVIEIEVIQPEQYGYAVNCRILGPECSLILVQYA